MKKTLLVLCTLLLPCLVLSQAIKVKKGRASVDGSYLCTIDGGVLSDAYRIKNQKGEVLFTVRSRSYHDPEKISPSNPKGKVSYHEFVFPGIEDHPETPSSFAKGVARTIHTHGLIKDGQLDLEAVHDFIISTGTPYSDNRPEKVIHYHR